jgi:hypothetical protein
MRRGVNWKEVFKQPAHMLHRYLYYYLLTDINTEIKAVIFNFSLYKSDRVQIKMWYKLARHV